MVGSPFRAAPWLRILSKKFFEKISDFASQKSIFCIVVYVDKKTMAARRPRERLLTAGKDRQQRGVAQLGRALALGARCRRFKSCHLDQSSPCGGNFMSVSKLHSHTPLGTASEPPATRHRGGTCRYRLTVKMSDFQSEDVVSITITCSICRCAGTGRRERLKNVRSTERRGSSPRTGTI